MGLYFMLLAGGSTSNISDTGGTFVFDISELTSKTRWSTGSAICSLLVQVLHTLSLVAYLRLMQETFLHLYIGSSVPLSSKITIP